jgi:hypothetical protein
MEDNPHAVGTGRGSPTVADYEQVWGLKNSFPRNWQKYNRVGMPHRRLFQCSWTFSIPQILGYFEETWTFSTPQVISLTWL